MMEMPNEVGVHEKLVAWGTAHPEVRAMILTSSRAKPDGAVDLLSDYDIVLAVTDADQWVRDEAWITDYGRPLVRWSDRNELHGCATYFRGVIYEDYVRLDYTLWPAVLLEHVAQAPLPPGIDDGYRVLLDKDGGTAAWPPPSHRAFVPARPTAAEYHEVVETFWWSTTYVAKSLWRDELVFARFSLDYDIKLDALRRMLEWRIEIENGWAVSPGVHGRGLKRWLPADIWSAFAATYVGPDLEDNWAALTATIGLFRRVAREVGAALGYTYPQELDERMEAYLSAIRGLPK